jgi:hypothetical protein
MEDWKYKVAKKKVKKVKGFYAHFATWLVFSAFFVILNIATRDNEFWAIFPIAGWGLGVALHAIGVFGFPGKNKDWEERMIEEEMSRLEEAEYHKRQQKPAGALPTHEQSTEEGLELKEVRKEWRDSDLV